MANRRGKKRIKNTGKTFPKIKDSGNALPRVDPEEVFKILGGEIVMRIRKLLMGFFNDKRKADLWFKTPNPIMGMVTPQSLIDIGRADRLLKIVETLLAQNKK